MLWGNCFGHGVMSSESLLLFADFWGRINEQNDFQNLFKQIRIFDKNHNIFIDDFVQNIHFNKQTLIIFLIHDICFCKKVNIKYKYILMYKN